MKGLFACASSRRRRQKATVVCLRAHSNKSISPLDFLTRRIKLPFSNATPPQKGECHCLLGGLRLHLLRVALQKNSVNLILLFPMMFKETYLPPGLNNICWTWLNKAEINYKICEEDASFWKTNIIILPIKYNRRVFICFINRQKIIQILIHCYFPVQNKQIYFI